MSDLSYDDLYSGLTGTSGGKPASAGQMPWPVTAKPHKRQTSVSEDDIINAGASAPGAKNNPSDSILSSAKPASDAKLTHTDKFVWDNVISPYINAQNDFQRGATQGVYDVLESPGVKALNAIPQTIAGPISQDIASLYGGHATTPDEDYQQYLAARDAFDASNPGVAANVGRVGGQAVASIPFMVGGNELLAAGTRGLEAAAPTATAFLRSSGVLPTVARAGVRATEGAAMGAASTPLTSAASDQSIGEQALENALMGGVISTGVPLAIGFGRAARRAVQPFTKAGRNALAEQGATNIVNQFTGGRQLTLDTREIVPGSVPTLAEAANDPGATSLQNALFNKDADANFALTRRQEANNAARGALVEAVSGTPQQLERAVQARDTAAAAARAAIWSNSHPVSTTPVSQAIDSVLAGPNGNGLDVRRAMADVQKLLIRDGQAITDPRTLYESVRKGIGKLIDGKDLNKSYGREAAAELMQVRDALDHTIESGAPGFQKYLSDYAVSSRPIDAMKFMQQYEPKNWKGDVTPAEVNRIINKLDAELDSGGVKKGKSTTLAQRQALVDLRDDLIRKDYINKGKPIGSNTVKNLLDQQRLGFVARNVGPHSLGVLGASAGGLIGDHFGGGWGAALGAGIGEGIGLAAGSRIPDVNALVRAATEAKLRDLVVNPAQNAHLVSGAGTGATQLFPNGIPPHVVPLAVIAKNRLLNRSR